MATEPTPAPADLATAVSEVWDVRAFADFLGVCESTARTIIAASPAFPAAVTLPGTSLKRYDAAAVRRWWQSLVDGAANAVTPPRSQGSEAVLEPSPRARPKGVGLPHRRS